MRSFILGVVLLAGVAEARAPAIPAVDAQVRHVIERYYAAIDRGDYRTAYAMWHGNKTYDQFRSGYARTARVRVTVGPAGKIDTGQGKLYTLVTTDVRAVLKNGRRQHFRGNFYLERPLDASAASAGGWSINNGCLTVVGHGECA